MDFAQQELRYWGGSVNVTASTAGTSDRSGSLTVKTTSGLSKSISVSQEGNSAVRVTVVNGFKFRSSKSVAFQISTFLYYRESQNAPSSLTISLGGGLVMISAGQSRTFSPPTNSVQVKSGSIFMGFKFQFGQYTGTFPERISLTATTITLNSSSIQVTSINNVVLNIDEEITTYCSNITFSDINEIDISNLSYQLS